MTFTCPKDATHLSADPDYCSECGAKIAPAVPAAPSPSSPSSSVSATDEVCPDCGTPRAGSAKFCEVCRYNFESATSFGNVAAPAPAAAVTVTPVIPAFASKKFDAVVVVDPSLYSDPDPAIPCPINEPEHTFPLDFSENLIGRKSTGRSIFPEIALNDPGISHRHAKLLLENDTVQLLELGSTNGTRLNGVDVQASVKTLLKSGDVLTLGCWTRMEIRER